MFIRDYSNLLWRRERKVDGTQEQKTKGIRKAARAISMKVTGFKSTRALRNYMYLVGAIC